MKTKLKMNISMLNLVAVKLALTLTTLFMVEQAVAEVNCNGGPTCTQTITLTPGWNAIYLQVDPDQNITEQVFADLLDGNGAQATSIWTWLAHRARIEFIQNPDTEDLISSPGWLRYFPAGSQKSILNNLYSVRANQAYLINVSADAETTLSITGRPVIPKTEWSSNSFNLTGFHIDPQDPPTFAEYFSASSAHQDQPVYQIISNSWQLVDTQITTIEPDAAYWVFSKGASRYTGELEIELPDSDGLDYGVLVEQLTPRIKNQGASPLSVNMQIIGGANGMYYANPDVSAEDRWLALPQPLVVEINSEEEKRIPVGVKRADFYLTGFEQTLEIKVAGGNRWLIPVSATAPELHSLWVGAVTIDQVSQAQNYQHNCDDNGINPGAGGYELCTDANGLPIGDAGDVMGTVGANFSFRLIIHREGTQARLLKDVTQMFKEGAGDVPGKLVLVTDQTLIPEFSGVALRNGETVGKRISTIGYDFEGDTADMTGVFDNDTTTLDTLSVTLTLPGTAPTNPFRHEYHPDHNNLAIDYQTPNNEAYDVTRTMTLTFTDNSASTADLGAGYNFREGTYREVVTGLHKYPIISSGTFNLQHASPVKTLNQ